MTAPQPQLPASGTWQTPAQLQHIYFLAARKLGWHEAALVQVCRARYGCAPAALNKAQASALIAYLQGLAP